MTIYDHLIIGIYFIFMLALGVVTKRLSNSSKDYFAGGFRMTWWMVGMSCFVANFSAWTFTGAAQVAHKYGIVIFAVFYTNVAIFVVQGLWLAPWFRQMRVVTAMDSVRDRYGRSVEIFYTIIKFFKGLAGVGVPILGTSIVVSSTFDLPQIPVILTLGIIVTVLSIMGGRWAVVASDFIQSILIGSITLVVAFLVIFKMGGLSAFWEAVPETNKNFFQASESQYDSFWVMITFLQMMIMFNSIDDAVLYVSVKDSKSASKAAFLAAAGFLIFPILFFIPPLAAHSLIPDLHDRFSVFSNPSEAAYIGVCMDILPQGMLGLLVAAIFAATMSSVDTGLNQLSGIFVHNFYKPLMKPLASEKELLKMGIFITALLGAFGMVLAIFLSQKDDLPLFEVYMMMNSYINLPMAIPLLLGLFVKKSPVWAPYPTIVLGVLVAIFFYDILPIDSVAELASTFFGEGLINYFINHQYVGANFVSLLLSVSFFLIVTKTFPNKDKTFQDLVENFFIRMKTPIDFEKEVGEDSSAAQCKMMGSFSFAYGVILLMCILIPNPIEGRMGFLFCSIIMMTIGGLLIKSARSHSNLNHSNLNSD
jgi:SSS family transporter